MNLPPKVGYSQAGLESRRVMDWQPQEANEQFVQVVRRTLDEGPQTVTLQGEPIVVIISVDGYCRLIGGQTDFKDFLRTGPDFSIVGVERSLEPAPSVEL